MNGFITAKEAAEKWNVTNRQVQMWCKNKMLDGAVMFGSSWAIPETVEKPTRTKNFKPGRKPKDDANK